MADNVKDVRIEIGGESRRFRYKYRGIAVAESMLESTFPQIITRMAQPTQVTAREWVVLIYAGLIHDNPDMTIVEVEEEFDYARLEEWAQAIAASMQASMPAAGEPAKKKPVRRGR